MTPRHASQLLGKSYSGVVKTIRLLGLGTRAEGHQKPITLSDDDYGTLQAYFKAHCKPAKVPNHKIAAAFERHWRSEGKPAIKSHNPIGGAYSRALWLTRQETGCSYPELARMLGQTSHSHVWEHCAAVEKANNDSSPTIP